MKFLLKLFANQQGNIGDAVRVKQINQIIDNGLFPNGKQGFWDFFGDWIQSSSLPASQNNRFFHRFFRIMHNHVYCARNAEPFPESTAIIFCAASSAIFPLASAVADAI